MENKTKSIIKTQVLLSDNGKEFDTGRAVRREVLLTSIFKEEALRLFDEGKRVYFIYPQNRIYKDTCRKVCKNRNYLIDHYDVYGDVCGVARK